MNFDSLHLTHVRSPGTKEGWKATVYRARQILSGSIAVYARFLQFQKVP